jgi:WD40 repeat protein
MQRGLIFINKLSLLFILFLTGAAITTPPSLFASIAAATPTTKPVSPPKALSTKSSWPKKPSFILSSPHECNYLLFSPDGKLLAGSARPLDSPVSIWETATGRLLRTLSMDREVKEINRDQITDMNAPSLARDFRSNLRSVAFSPDSKLMASGTWWGEINLWDIATGDVLKTLGRHRKTVNCVAFSPDGKLLASGSSDQTIKIWDLATGRCLRTLNNLEVIKKRIPDIYNRYNKRILPSIGVVSFLAFSPDGNFLASGGGIGSLVTWQVKTGGIFSAMGFGGFSPDSFFSFSRDGKSLIFSSWSPDTIYITNIRTRANPVPYFEYQTPSDYSVRISFNLSPDLRNAATISPDAEKVNFWDLKRKTVLHTFISQNKYETLITLALSPDGKWLAVARSDNKIELWPIPKEF